MMKRRLCLFGVAALLLGGAVVYWYSGPDKVFPREVRTVLDAPDTFEFMTIDPSHEDFDPDRAGTMHGYAILGRVAITDVTVQKRLVRDLYAAVKNRDDMAAGCFNPRHAIRVTRGGKVVDVVICFECQGLEVYAGESPMTGSHIDAAAKADFEGVAHGAKLAATGE